MRPFQPFPRRKLRELQRDWIRRNSVLVTASLLGTAGTGVALSLFLVLLRPPGHWYLMGVLHAGLLASVLHLMYLAFLTGQREAIWQLRGAWGEENTRSELERAKRRQLIWGWVDSITLKVGDLDHVVITKSGGIVVLDSKWRSEVTRDTVADMAASARRMQIRAEALTRTLLKTDRTGRRRVRRHSIVVTPVVVLWGRAREGVPDGHQVDSVHFIDGRKLVPWLRRMEGQAVTQEAAKDIISRLTEYRAMAFKSNLASQEAHARDLRCAHRPR